MTIGLVLATLGDEAAIRVHTVSWGAHKTSAHSGRIQGHKD